jgi:hypothetical protein
MMQIGVALKEVFSSGVVQRSELFITSKLWYLFHLMLVFNLISNDYFLNSDYMSKFCLESNMAFLYVKPYCLC